MKKIGTFLLLNFILTWGAWITVIFSNEGGLTPGKPIYILYGLGGLLGPLIAAFVAQPFGTKEEYRLFMKQLIRVRVSYFWYIGIFFLPLILSIIPFLTEWMLTSRFTLNLERPYYMLIIMLPVFIIGGGIEEIGWRGVLLPELCKKFSISIASLIVSTFWVVWHLPLWFMVGTVQYGSNFGYFALSLLGSTLLLSVVYLRTKSIFLCVILHALFNANAAYFPEVSNESQWNEPISIAIKLILCMIIFFFMLRKQHPLKLERNNLKVNRTVIN